MVRSAFLLCLLAVTCCTAHAFDRLKGKPYHFAIEITNPLSATSKYGGLAEIRFGQSAFTLGATNYVGAYTGMQFKLEYLYYLPTIYRNETFAYVKLASGNAQYESNKLSILGEDRDFKVGPVDYTGGGIGMGRRWNLNHFCIVFNGGLKYVALPQNLSDENRKHFDLFYGTGPGSIIDLNFKIGYQF